MASLYDRISKGTMSVDEITESMRRATSEGGKFFEGMQKQSQTLNGQLSTLKDNADQLLGSLTEGLANDLRDDLLPLANNMISTLQEAFDKDGMQGLLDAATGMMPDLLNMMTGRIEDSLASLAKFAPKAVNSIMKGIPAAIRSGSNVLPQITAALFDVAGLVVSELVSMLPELVPQVLSGFGNMFNEALKGTFKLISGFYTGIEQAIHQGQTKVMGMWVDNEKIAKYDFSIELDVDPTNAYQEIETAYSNLRSALSTDLLTPDQRDEILGMIGDDYEAVYNKLTSFGLSSGDAKTIADAVSTTNKALNNVLSRLDVSVPTETILQWFEEARGSKLYLIEAMKRAGLSESEINQITEVYDGMLGRVTDNTPSIVQEIYDKLSDGKPDDTQTVEALRSDIEEYIGGLLTELDSAYEEKLGGLDSEDPEYGEKVSALQGWYNETKATIMSMNTEMVTLVETLAGAPTATVQARLAEYVELERRLGELETEIQATSEKAATEAENAFKVVRSGAKADEQTISLAINFKASQYKVDTQAAEDTYNAAMTELNDLFARGEISKEEFDLQAGENAATLESSKAAAQAAYEQAMGEIFKGIAESEGTLAAFESTGMQALAIQMLDAFMAEINSVGWENVDPAEKAAVGEALTALLGEGFTVDDMDFSGPATVLSNAYGQLTENLDTSVLSGKIAEVIGKATEDGVLAGTAFDTTDPTQQIAAIYASVYDAAVSSAESDLISAGDRAGKIASSEIGDYDGGYNGATQTVNGARQGLLDGTGKLGSAASMLAQTIINAFYRKLGIASPSKVMMEIGKFTGQGFEIGLRESMQKAVATATRIVGGLHTSANLRIPSYVGNMPDLQQEIMLANEQNPVRLYVNGRELGQVTAADNNRAQNAYRRSIALGVGK